MDTTTPKEKASLNCKGCGSVLLYVPGTHQLQCQYCRSINTIDTEPVGNIKSYDIESFLLSLDEGAQTREAITVHCKKCGAETTLPPAVTSGTCPFCATPVIVGEDSIHKILQPHYILPFIVDKKEAIEHFRKWLKGLWFAPSGLSGNAGNATLGRLRGMYLPHWCYDTNTITEYSGERGDYYYETERYTENGEVKYRKVRRTRWSYTSGTVFCTFNDVLVSASASISQNVSTTLEPWDLSLLVDYDERYYSGFHAETYQLDVVNAFDVAKQKMNPHIEKLICDDIGGDDQRIDETQTTYNDIALKYIMLPVWISAYQYKDKTYKFVVNACTGEVTGSRPYSWIKITLAVLLGIGILAVLYLYMKN